MEINKKTEEFIQKAKDKHGDYYDYSQVVYVNSHTDVKIICPKHGLYFQRPNNHLYGYGCKLCINDPYYTQDIFMQKAKDVHGDRYDYSKVKFKSLEDDVRIICKVHNISPFKIKAKHHLLGKGCPQCGDDSEEAADFKKKSREIHGNVKYNYDSVVYANNNTEVKIKCPKHGFFNQTPHNHLSGRGCPQCKGEFKHKKIDDFGWQVNVNDQAQMNYLIERFVETAYKIHGDIYDLTRFEWNGFHENIKVVCPIDGEFLITPYEFLVEKKGCPECFKQTGKYPIGRGSDYYVDDKWSDGYRRRGDKNQEPIGEEKCLTCTDRWKDEKACDRCDVPERNRYFQTKSRYKDNVLCDDGYYRSKDPQAVKDNSPWTFDPEIHKMVD
jgi:hypothetical protein